MASPTLRVSSSTAFDSLEPSPMRALIASASCRLMPSRMRSSTMSSASGTSGISKSSSSGMTGPGASLNGVLTSVSFWRPSSLMAGPPAGIFQGPMMGPFSLLSGTGVTAVGWGTSCTPPDVLVSSTVGVGTLAVAIQVQVVPHWSSG
ncbi:hypothetical protein ACKVWC_011543 [Pyricularia oryzae]